MTEDLDCMIEPDLSWSEGLCTMTRNALHSHGFESREQLKTALVTGKFHIKPKGGGGSFSQIGKGSIREIYRWFEMSEPEIKRPPPSQGRIDAAIKLLERVGYRVEKITTD